MLPANMIELLNENLLVLEKCVIGNARNEDEESFLTVRFNRLREAIKNEEIITIRKHLRTISRWYTEKVNNYKNKYLYQCYGSVCQINQLLGMLFGIHKEEPIVFLSHSKIDKIYADMLRDFLEDLGIDESRLIYTSDPKYGVPFGKNIYEYLRNAMNDNIFMIILWSNSYVQSTPCLCELGAMWVKQCGYANIFVPKFNHNSIKYRKSPVDHEKAGIILNGDVMCRSMIHQFKDELVKTFNFDKKQAVVATETFIRSLSNVEIHGAEYERIRT